MVIFCSSVCHATLATLLEHFKMMMLAFPFCFQRSLRGNDKLGKKWAMAIRAKLLHVKRKYGNRDSPSMERLVGLKEKAFLLI